MTTNPLFTPIPDGSGYNIRPAGVLLLSADTVYGEPTESTPEGRARAQALIDAMLAAARAGGYAQCDILHTLLARNKLSARVQKMAVKACNAAGDTALRKIFVEAGL